MMRRSWRGLVAFAAVYVLLYAVSVRVVAGSNPLTPLWPPAGALLAGLLLLEDTPPWAVLGTAFLAGRLAGTSFALPGLETLAFAGAAWVEALCAQALIRRRSGPRVRFTRVRDVTALLWATVLAVTVNSLLVGVIEWRAGRDVRSALLTSWISGFLGILLFTPLMIAWARPQETTGTALRLPASRQLPRMLEASAMCLLAAGMTWVVFKGYRLFDVLDLPPYALSVPLVWAALRFDLRGITTAVLLVAVFSSILVLGAGATVLGGETPEVRLLRLQLLIGFLTITGLVLSAALAERRAAAESEARAAAALVASERRLQQSQKMEAVGQLAGGIAHDFNNILSVMSLQVHEIQKAGGLEARTRQTVQELQDTVERAAAFTQRLLLFGRRTTKEEQRIDLNEVAASLARLLTRLMPSGITFTIEPSSTPLWVMGDPSMMEQVVMNLVINARDAMSQGPRTSGGRLTLTAGVHRLTEDEQAQLVTLHPEVTPRAHAVLRVADTGHGIAPEHLAQLFEPFFTTKAAGEGTGLGLSTVFTIAQQHQGYVRVLTTSAAGTTFEFGVPLLEEGTPAAPAVVAAVPPRAEVEAAAAAAPDDAADAPVVLLVEDHDEVRRIIQRILERDGLRVVTAIDGADALARWDDLPPIALLLTDVVMPGGVTGVALARELRTRDPALRVIYTSGYDPSVADAALELVEGENFIPKPAPPSLIVQTVRFQLQRAVVSSQ